MNRITDDYLKSLGFQVKKPSDYNQGVDLYTKPMLIDSKILEDIRKELSKNAEKKIEFMYFITIRPIHGYDINDGLEIVKHNTPFSYYGETLFKGKVQGVDELNILFRQLEVN